tara:strand:+ start:433 stop:612 length:180 start_codon:yes stop_codon:yes gene_type:complete
MNKEHKTPTTTQKSQKTSNSRMRCVQGESNSFLLEQMKAFMDNTEKTSEDNDKEATEYV